MKYPTSVMITVMASTYSYAEAGLRQAKWNLNPAMRSAFTNKSTNNVTEEDIIHFKNCYSLLNDTEIKLQDMSSSNTLTCQGKTYEIKDINKELQIFTENATYWYGGVSQEIPESNIYQREDTEEIITVVKNLQQEVESVTIINKTSRETVSLYNISPKYPHVFAEVKESDYDFDELNRIFSYDQSEEYDDTERHLSYPIQIQSKQRKTVAACSSYKVVELAAAYESSFCRHYGGTEDAAIRQVKLIVAGMNDKYKMHACMKVKLSHLEGYCDPNIDPYKGFRLNLSGCNNDGLLDDVQEYWNKNRKDVHRDAMQLFSGTEFKDERDDNKITVGCAPTMSICTNKAYGVNHITYSESMDIQTALVAHELGHNLGASHYDKEEGFIMSPTISSGSKGFSDESINKINSTISRTSCIHEEQPASPPSSPTQLYDETGRIFIDIKDINTPNTSVNRDRMILVVKDAANAAIDDQNIIMIFSDHKLEKKKTEDKLYNYNFAVNANKPSHCVGDCNITEQVSELIRIEFEKNFDTTMKKAADDHEVKHLFKNAKVDMTSFVDNWKFVDPQPPTSSPITYSPTLIWPSINKNCKNSLQPLIKRFQSILI